MSIKDIRKNSPYFDDYNEDSRYYQVMVRPGFGVQTRELNTLQTMMQEQVARMGKHFFREGSVVIPGACVFDTNYQYVKVYTNLNINNTVYFVDDLAIQTNFIGKTITSPTGVRARIVNYTPVDMSGVIRFYVKYLSAGTETGGGLQGALKNFVASEVLSVDDSGIQLETHIDSNLVVGIGTGANINRGVYFTNGFFALVLDQSIVVEPESRTPSVSIGLNVKLQIVTPEEDNSLLDNVPTSTNYSAPGAHRIMIDLVLATRPIDKINTTSVTDKDFIELVRLVDGIPFASPNRTDYNLIKDELARRTFDESGNYTIKPFVVVANPFLNNGTNQGVYTRDMLKRSTAQSAEAIGSQLLGLTGSHVYGDGFLPGIDNATFEAACATRIVYQIDPGKAYVNGYDIERLDRSKVVGKKALDFESSKVESINSSRGPFVQVTDVEGLPATAWGQFNTVNNSFEEVLLFSRRKEFLTSPSVPLAPGSVTTGTPDVSINSPYCIGTAKAFYWDFEGGSPGTSGAHYRLHLVDVKITKNDYTFEHVQSIRQDPIGAISPTTAGFFANVVQHEEPFLGATISKTTPSFRSLLSGDGTYWRTLEYQSLGKNDCITATIDGTTNEYFYAINPPLNNEDILVDGSSSVVLSSKPISRLYTILEEQDAASLLFLVPKGFVKSIDESNVDYSTQVLFTSTVGVGNQITINLTQGIFASFSNTEWFFSKQDGTIVKAISVNFPTAAQAEIEFSVADVSVGDEITSLVSIRITDAVAATPKTKTLRVGTYQNTGIPSGQYYVLTQANDNNLQRISLGVEDVIRIKAIYMSSDFVNAPLVTDLDIKDRYVLDNGQTDVSYDISSITLKRGAQVPTGRLAIVFDYFEHSTSGRYFSIDSYPISTTFTIEDIPTYISKNAGQSYPLASVLDFRPTKNSSGKFLEKISYIPEANILLSYDYYLHRNDKIVLLPDGQFRVIEGVSSLRPSMPDDPVEGMVIADLELPAITTDPKRIVVTHRNNRRYTMRDIGKLEDRVSNIEYYTALNLLETSTEALVLKDADGNDRFKNGFLVDNFRGHSVGDVTNEDYSCAVDPKVGELRPPFVERSVDLVETKPYANNVLGFEDSVSDIDRSNSGYVKRGDLLMLDYDSIESVSQRIASSTINVNPFEVVTYVGSVKLTPSTDEFKSTEILPESIVNFDTGLADALTNLSVGLGTVYTKDSTEFNTTSTTETTEIDPIISPPIPGPAFGANLGQPNEAMLWLNRKIKDASDLQRRERDLLTLKGQLASTSDKKARQGLQNKIKSIEKAIKSAKKLLNSQTPAKETTFPRLAASQTKTVTAQQTSAKGGTKLNVTTNTIQSSLGESVKEISFAEFCRSQIIHFKLSGFKPNSRLYAFIDQTPVTHLCISKSAAQEIVVPSTERRVIGQPFYVHEHITTDSTFPVVVGDSTSPTSFVFLNPSTNANSSGLYPLVANEFGLIEGYMYLPNGLPIVTAEGTVLSDSVLNPRFKTGSKIIQFTDSPNNIASESESSGSAKFDCQGLIEKKQNTIISSKGAKLSTEYDNFEKIITQSTDTDYKLNKLCWVDPIAETINITEAGGVFMAGVTVYFRNKPYIGSGGNFRSRTGVPNQPIPVSLELRETVAGVPGPKLVPGSKVYLYPNQVVINEIENDTTTDIGQLWISVPNPSNPDNVADVSHIHYGPYTDFASDGANEPVWNPQTRTLTGLTNATTNVGFVGTYFEFEHPVYLEEKSEYAIVVSANCQDYEVWKASITERQAGKSNIIQNTASYNGVLLKSTNSSTWTPDQTSDLMFKTHKAQFVESAQVTLVNEEVPYDKLKTNPFKVEAGSNVIKVTHKNHGMRNRIDPLAPKPRVKIFGVISPVGGISPDAINTESSTSVKKYHDVVVLDFDSYAIEITDLSNNPVNADSTTYSSGGSSVFASKDIQVDEMTMNIVDIVLKDTDIAYSYRIASGSGVHGSDLEPYVLPNTFDFESSQANQLIKFESPNLVAGVANEGRWTISDPLITGILTTPGNVEGSSKSLFVNLDLTTSNPNVSPIVDLTRSTVKFLGNKVSDPGLANEYTSIVEPTDYMFFGFKQVQLNVPVVQYSSQVTLTSTTSFHVDGFVLLDDGSSKNLRKIIGITPTVLTLDKPITVSAPCTVSSSALDRWGFADEKSQIVSGISLDILNSTFSTTNPTIISLLSEVFPGALVEITNGVDSVTTRITSVVRATSLDVTITVEADLGLVFGNTTVTGLSVSVYRDVVSVSGLAGTYTEARNIGKSILSSMKSGQYIKVMNSGTNKNDSTYQITNIVEVVDDTFLQEYKLNIFVKYDVDYDPTPTNITLLGIEDFYGSESAVGGTAPATYVTKRMVLRNPATALNVRFLANVQEGQDIEVYAKFSGADDITNFDDNRYVEIKPAFNKIPGDSKNSSTYNEYNYEEALLPPFTTVAIKIVMKGNNSSKPVRVKDLQVIALDS